MAKSHVHYRFSDRTQENLEGLKEKLNWTETAVVEEAIRRMAEVEKISRKGKMMNSTISITEVTLFSLTPSQVSELNFQEENPLDDNGGDTDGPSSFLEAAKVRELEYGEIAPEGFFFGNEVEGYKLEGYSQNMREAFEVAGIRRWMGNDIQQFAYFVASEKQLAALETALAELED